MSEPCSRATSTRRSVGNCRISSMAPIEVFLTFRGEKGRVEGLPRKGGCISYRDCHSGAKLRQQPVSLDANSVLAQRGNPFIGWVSSSSQNFEMAQDCEKGAEWVKRKFWSPSRSGLRLGVGRLVRRGGGRGDGPSPIIHPQPGSHTLSSSG